jgi:hypothetical protein
VASAKARGAPARAPAAGPAGNLFALQQTAGNRAVAHLLGGGTPVLRRACACGGHSGGGKPCAGCAGLDEDEQLRRTPDAPGGSRADGGSRLPDGLATHLARSRGRGSPLERGVREPLERSFGRELGAVRVHSGAAAALAARSVRARAFALGKEIWFGAGEYRPHDPAGRRLIAHEVAHTLEQRPVESLDRVRLGAANDPAEARADRAAAAVARHERPPAPGQSDGILRRYSITRVDPVVEGGETVVNVDLDNGIRYRVRRVCSVIQEERTSVGFRPPRVSAGADRENVYVEVSWCQGTRGRVTAGADVPEQFQQAIQRVIEGALAGRSPDDVLRETTLNPFVDFAIAQSGGLSVEGRVQVTVGGEGVQAGEGSITFRHGPVDVGVTGRGGGEGGLEVGLTLTFTPGRRSQTFDCPTTRRRRERVRRRCIFECTHGPIAPPPEQPRQPEARPEQATATTYFEYARSSLNARLNDPEAARLASLLRQGYRVQAIRGFASPEGPLERQTGRFQGNRTLSRERADAALAEVTRLCAQAGMTGSCLVAADAPVTGCGERLGGATECPTPGEGQVRTERRGREVARVAVREFMADPAEMARLTPEDRDRLTRATTDDAKARLIYPYLRRASLELVRLVEQPRRPIDITLPRLPPDYFFCPQDVIDAARRHLLPRAPGPRR